MKYYAIINPDSGGKHGQRIIEQLRQHFANGLSEGEVVVFDPTRIEEQLRNAAHYDRLLVGGGDGTIASVCNHHALQRGTVPIGILPLGTGNDLAREYCISRSLARWPVPNILEFYSSPNSLPLQLWKLSLGGKDLHFSNYFSFGFDAVVIELFARLRKSRGTRIIATSRWGNRLLYFIAAVFSLGHTIRAEDLSLTIDGQSVALKSNYRGIIIANVKSIAGLGWANFSGNSQDRQLEVLLVRSVLSYPAMLLPQWIRDLCKLPHFGIASIHTGSHISISCANNYAVQIDGESYPCKMSQTSTITPAGIVQILCGKNTS